MTAQLSFVDSFALSLVCRQERLASKRDFKIKDFTLSCSQIVPHGLYYGLGQAYSWWSCSKGLKDILHILLENGRWKSEERGGNKHKET